MDLLNDQIFLQNVVKKAREDAAFKNSLLGNPVAAMEDFSGYRIDIPQGKKVFVTQTGSTISIDIISESVVEDMELNEEQLDIIAGGSDPTFIKS